MYYHFAIILLFGPFTKVRFLGSSVAPKEICLQAAITITSLVGVYRQLYSLRRTPSFFPYIVLASSIIQLAAVESTHFNSNLPGHADLLDMMASHDFAHCGKEILRILAHNQNTAAQMAKDANNRLLQVPTFNGEHFFSSEMVHGSHPRYSSTDNSIFSPFESQVLPLHGFQLIS
jgi:hypothetical protein